MSLVCRVPCYLLYVLPLIHPHARPRGGESRRCSQASRSMGQNHPHSPREAAQKRVERPATVQHPHITDVTTEAQTGRAEPGAEDTGGDKTHRMAALMELTISEGRKHTAPGVDKETSTTKSAILGHREGNEAGQWGAQGRQRWAVDMGSLRAPAAPPGWRGPRPGDSLQALDSPAPSTRRSSQVMLSVSGRMGAGRCLLMMSSLRWGGLGGSLS